MNKLCGRPPQYALPLQIDLLTLKVVSRVGYLCDNFSPGLSVLDLYIRPDVRETDAVRRQTRIIA